MKSFETFLDRNNLPEEKVKHQQDNSGFFLYAHQKLMFVGEV